MKEIGKVNLTKGIVTMLAAATLSGVSAAEKAIVVYFSHTGENYAVGNITEGNTAKVAKVIAARTGSPLYEIKEAKPYPSDYRACVDLAKKELQSNARPELAGELPDLSEYSVIYLGYPNWWGAAPMAVYSFLDKVKLDGKTIIPFCTHEGSGLGSTAGKLAKAFPKAKFEPNGLSLRGATAQRDAAATEEAVTKWLKSLGKVE